MYVLRLLSLLIVVSPTDVCSIDDRGVYYLVPILTLRLYGDKQPLHIIAPM